MNRFFLAVLLTISVASVAHAQSDDAGPIATPAGKLQFTRQGREFTATLDATTLDHFNAWTLTHFDDINDHDDVSRMLVDTDAGPVIYDFRSRPPLVLRTAKGMTIKRVFWQGEEVVMQGSQGWFRYEHGVLTKLQSTTTTYH